MYHAMRRALSATHCVYHACRSTRTGACQRVFLAFRNSRNPSTIRYCNFGNVPPSNVEENDQLHSEPAPRRKINLKSISKSAAVVHMKDLEDHMRIRGYSTLRWGLALLAVIGYGIYHFREPIKENLSDEVADVASRSLADETVLMRANEITRAILFELMNDPDALTVAVDFLSRTLKSDHIVQSTTDLAIQVINDPSTRHSVDLLASHTLSSLLETQETRQMLLDYIKSLLLDEQTQMTCKQLLQDLIAMPEVKTMVANLLSDAIKSETVTQSASDLGKNVTGQVVTDPQIQEKTGDAMWETIKYSLLPRWLYQAPKPAD